MTRAINTKLRRAIGAVSRRLLLAAVPLVALAPGPAAAQTTLDQFGMQATTAVVECNVFGCQFADDVLFEIAIGNLSVASPDGGVGALSASAMADAPGGFTTVDVQLVGGLSTPQITASANSTANYWVQANGIGVQGYTYTGTTTTDITVDVTLTGFVSHPSTWDSTGLSALVALFRPDTGFTFPTSGLLNEVVLQILCDPAFLPACSPRPGVASTEIEFTDGDPLDDSVLGISSVTLQNVAPGEGFYLLTLLAASAGERDSFAESTNTLSVAFATPAGLNPVATTIAAAPRRVVPMPLWASMLLLILLPLGARLRRGVTAR